MTAISINESKFYDVIRAPVITEKSSMQGEIGKYVFKVQSGSNKALIKSSVESLFGVKVVSVNVINTKGKNKRFKGRKGYTSGYKKAIVTLAEGDSIDLTGKV